MKYTTINLCNKIAVVTIRNTLCHKINYRTSANTILCEHELSIYNADSISDVNSCIADFDVLLIVHLSIILIINQLDAQNLV